MFVDKVAVTIQAGKGGDGLVSFRRERFVDRGGPDGGDGGDGGSVVFQASRNQNTLAAFRYQKLLRASDGVNGKNAKKRGKKGADLVVSVPEGTLVKDISGEEIADLVHDGQTEVLAEGGKGGFGNAHFTSSTRQAPRVAEKGQAGQLVEAVLELKMIADVGLIGLPNAGKSTLLSVISAARPEIANYPFTTLKPNLGVVDISAGTSLLFADIPGLIEGASQGKGLGGEFLRHIERTKALVHLIDIHDDYPEKAYQTIRSELKAYSQKVAAKPEVVVLSKVEGLSDKQINQKSKTLKKVLPNKTKLLTISAHSKQGLKTLLIEVNRLVNAQPVTDVNDKKAPTSLPVIKLEAKDSDWQIITEKKKTIILGPKIELFAAKTDFENPHSVERLHDILRRQGILKELERRGLKTGTKIYFGRQKNIQTVL